MRRGTPLVLVVEYAGHVRKSCAPQHRDKQQPNSSSGVY